MKQTIVIYSNHNQECERVRSLLDKYDGVILEYFLGKDFDNKDFIAEFGPEAEYPQVAIASRHIGGMKDVLNYLKNQNLL